MMTCHFVDAEQAKTYFAHESDYYTRYVQSSDRWYGTLAKSLGFSGQLTKEQFDIVMDLMQKYGRKRGALDCTFSAPKSVSLLLGKDKETRELVIACHNQAIKKVMQQYEQEMIRGHDEHKKQVISNNMIAAGFTHFTSRPTWEKEYISDLSLHTHCVIVNATVIDKVRAVDYRHTLRNVKKLGLDYSSYLATEMQQAGFALEVTDVKNGFWEVKGIGRDIIENYSSRTRQIEQYASEYGVDKKSATLLSRESKSKSKMSEQEIFAMVQRDLFDSGKVKAKIDLVKARAYLNHEKDDDHHERDTDYQRQQIASTSERICDDRTRRTLPYYQDFTEDKSISNLANFADCPRLQNLQSGSLDVSEQRQSSRHTTVLLSPAAVNLLGKLQESSTRDYFMRKAHTAEVRKKRANFIKQVDQIACEAINELAKEKFAFTVPDTIYRIRAAGVLLGITEKEAQKAIERMGLVRLGPLERDGKRTQDQYLTTEGNLIKERRNVERVIEGKKAFAEQCMSMEEAMSALKREEQQAIKEGRTDFSIIQVKAGHQPEQAQAVCHIMTCEDRFIGIDGLAGTGKTTMLERLKWIADSANIELIGACYTGKAADGLQAESGIPSWTIHAFLNAVEAGRFNDIVQGQQKDAQQKTQIKNGKGAIKQEWDFSAVKPSSKRRIICFDEAGLIDSNLMDQVQKALVAMNAQGVFLGDPLQYPPIGEGQPFRDMEEAGMATAHLNDIRRQKEMELLQAVRASVTGNHLETFKILERQGHYHEIQDKKQRREAIVKDVTQTKLQEYIKNGKEDILLLVSTNADRKLYNRAIREVYIKRGEIERGKSYTITTTRGDDVIQEKREFAEQDRIIFLSNDSRLKVKNGTLGTIQRIEPDGTFLVKTDVGKDISFNVQDYNHIDHSYAITSYKAQGATVNRAIFDMPTKASFQTRNALYVDVSRARYSATVYTDDKAVLERQTAKWAKKITGKDFLKRIDKLQAEGIQYNDRYHTPDEDYKQALTATLTRIHKQCESMRKEQSNQGNYYQNPQKINGMANKEKQMSKELSR